LLKQLRKEEDLADIIGQLEQLGFSQYEAQAYLALLRENPVNGYQLANNSGIPRANIYLVLQRLEERGAILRLTLPDGVRYIPLPAQELISDLKRHYQEIFEATSQSLSEETPASRQEFTLNFHGYPTLVDHARRMLERAQRELVLIVWPDEAFHLAGPLRKAAERGVQLMTLCLNGCRQACPACQGDIFRYPIAETAGSRWLVMVADQVEMLAGEIIPGQDAMAVLTRQKMLVSLAAGYIQNTLALARILSGLGNRLEGVLDPQARFDLNLLQKPDRWLDTMRQRLLTQENQD
jgi:sugar-specific transcriptional regulator TrmB